MNNKLDQNYRKECFCGSNYGRLGHLEDSKCFYPCTGNRLELCGGIGANDVYSTGIEFITKSNYLTTNNKEVITDTTKEFQNEVTSKHANELIKDTTSSTIELTTSIGKIL